MVEWYVKAPYKGAIQHKEGTIAYFPCSSKEAAEEFAERLNGEAISMDKYAREFIENSRNIIYRNQEGRTEKERRRRAQRTWFISYLLRW